MKLTTKTVAAVLAVLTVTLSFCGWLEIKKERVVLEESLRNYGASLSQVLAISCRALLAEGRYDEVKSLIANLAGEKKDVLSVEVLHGEKLVAEYYARRREGVHKRSVFQADILSPGQEASRKLGVIYVGLSREKNKLLMQLRVQELIIRSLAIFFVLLVTLVFILKKLLIRQIRVLCRYAEGIGKGDFLTRIDIKNRDELGELARALKEMSTNMFYYQRKIKSQQKQMSSMILGLQRAREAAEAANEAKSRFLADMSHELRTPMSGIVGMTEVVMDSPLSEEQKDCLSMVKSSADELLVLVNDILDFSKIEAGRLELEKVEFALRGLLKPTVEMWKLPMGNKNLEFDFRISPQVPDNLLGDPARLRQVINNLLNNAVKFTPSGRVALRVSLWEETDERASVHFAVSDTGIGIPRHKRRSVFEAFSQAEQATSRKYGGTGLGLNICCQLVQMMGGKIWVESEEGRGTVFHFTVVMEKVKEGDNEEALSWLKEKAVLVAAPDEGEQLRLQGLLQGWGMKPWLLKSGKTVPETLRRAARKGIDFPLVLLDLDLRDVDSLYLAEEIRPEVAKRGGDIIFLSAPGKRAGGGEGGVRCVEKPVAKGDLREAIREMRRHPAPLDVTVRLEPLRQLQVLVADDSFVNLRLLGILLGKHGHRVVTVNNGREAIQMWEKERFDMVFMDINMPVMDGLSAAAAIREREGRGAKTVPIIGMTAGNGEDGRERCLRAGMDDCMVKPVKGEGLYGVIKTHLPEAYAIGKETEEPLLAPESKEGGGAVREKKIFDKDALLRLVTGDRRLLQEIVSLFLNDYPKRMDEIHRAIGRGDAAALNSAAHALKGMAGNFFVPRVVQAAWKLEQMGRNKDLRRAREACLILEEGLRSLAPALNDLAAGRQ